MSLVVKKLDNRNSGAAYFKYYVTSVFSSVDAKAAGLNGYSRIKLASDFMDIRSWSWQTWGPSKELVEWVSSANDKISSCQNEHWCWQNDERGRRLYLRSDEELILYKLRWE